MLALAPLLALATSASALVIQRDCAATCQYVCYTQDAIDAALQAGYSNYQAGTTAGGSTYPHAFDDREGFTIPTSGPWFEFPILASGDVYSGGPPGADRVVFDSNGDLDLVVTHHGASGSNFVQC